jgi:hypothetical protein
MAFTCFALSFYLSKYQKDPIATVQLNKGGCFGHSSYKLSLLHGDNSIIARLDSGKKMMIQIPISKSQLDSFDAFAKELSEMKDGGGCTSYYIYKLSYKNRLIKKEDWSCSWDGFHRLLICFFGVSEKTNFL